MVGQGSKFVEDDVNMNKYHGRRRNATSNINRNVEISSSSQSSSNRIGRVQQNPIYSRLSTNTRQLHNKKDYRWKSGQESACGSKSDTEQRSGPNNRYKYKKTNKEVYSAMQSVGRLKITPKSYKIGDDNNDKAAKLLIPSQSFCKLAGMDQGVFDLIVSFMQQYFTCFDKNREELLAAYHTNALFSMSFNLKSQAIPYKRTTRFGAYVRESRNQCFVQNEERVYEMLQRSNISIIAHLKKLASTEHVSSSLKLDTCFFQPNMVTFSISGVYKERHSAEEKFSCFRSFQRTFVCVPVSSDQMIIVNEQCMISNLSEQQLKVYKEEALGSPKSSNIQQPSMSIESTGDPKKDMIAKFSRLTNLTDNWSKDCLEFSHWNFAVAEKNFYEHRNEIPAEAYKSAQSMN